MIPIRIVLLLIVMVLSSPSNAALGDMANSLTFDGYDLRPFLDPKKLRLHSSTALIIDLNNGSVLYEKNITKQRSIASLTKLMTAMVTLDKWLDPHELIEITKADKDRLRNSKSRVPYGAILTRHDLIKISLVASDNRAASALARTYPGGREYFIMAMNAKAKALGMMNTFYLDSTGLHSQNVSTAVDMAILVKASTMYPLIKEYSTIGESYVLDTRHNKRIKFLNTNKLVRTKVWDINISKTGYIADAGYCLVMHTDIINRPMVIILLNSQGKYTKFADSDKIRVWLIKAEQRRVTNNMN